MHPSSGYYVVFGDDPIVKTPVAFARCADPIAERTNGTTHVMERIPPDIHHSKHDSLLERIAHGVSTPIDQSSHEELARLTADILGVSHAFIGFLRDPSDTQLYTSTLILNGNVVDNTTFDLSGSPCENVIQGDVCLVTHGMHGLFPDDSPMANGEVNCYAGAPLFVNGKPVGLLAAFGPEQLVDEAQVRAAIRIMAARLSNDMQQRRTEDHFRVVANMTTDILWDYDPLKDELQWSGNGEAFGHGLRTLGTHLAQWESVIHPDDRPRVVASFLSAVNSADYWSEEYRFRKKDGTYAHVVDAGQILRNHHNHPVRVVGYITDISQRKALEQKLLQAQKLDSIGRLVGGIAHDFNNLLTIILSGTDYALDVLDDQQECYLDLEDVKDAARRAASLTRQLQAFSRQQSLDPVELDLNKALGESLELVGRTLNQNITVEFLPDHHLKPVMADPGQITQVLLNLATNSQNAMPQGGKIRISTMALDAQRVAAERLPPTDHALLEFSDTGEGICPNHLPLLFDPFFTTQDVGQGAGLGLPTVYGIVKQSGGDIRVKSIPGQGTTFRIFLPAVAADGAPDQPESPSDKDKDLAHRIMLVEDDEMVAQMAQQALERAGYIIITMNCVEQAIEALSDELAHRPDLIITDMMLPGLSGKDLVSWLGEHQPGTRVIVTSGYTDIADSFGPNPSTRFLAKPYSLSQLRDAARELLKADP